MERPKIEIDINNYQNFFDVGKDELKEKFPKLTQNELRLLNRPVEGLSMVFASRPELLKVFLAVLSRAQQLRMTELQVDDPDIQQIRLAWYELKYIDQAIQYLKNERNKIHTNDLIFIKVLTQLKDVFIRIMNPHDEIDLFNLAQEDSVSAIGSLIGKSKTPMELVGRTYKPGFLESPQKYSVLYFNYSNLLLEEHRRNSMDALYDLVQTLLKEHNRYINDEKRLKSGQNLLQEVRRKLAELNAKEKELDERVKQLNYLQEVKQDDINSLYRHAQLALIIARRVRKVDADHENRTS